MSYDEIFNRVSKLVDEVVVKSAKHVKRAQDPTEEKYNTWSEVEPTGDSFTKELDRLLSDTVPANPTAVDEATEGTDKEIEDAYPLAEVSTVSEDGSDNEADVEEPVEGEDVLKEGQLKNIPTHVLVNQFVKLAKEMVTYVSPYDPRVERMVSNDPDSASSVAVAKVVKQAEFDASMVYGFLLKRAEDAAQEEEASAIAENLANAAEGADEGEASSELPAGEISPEDEAALQEIEAIVDSTPPEEISEVITQIVSERPDVAAAVVEANPELAEELVVSLAESGVPGAAEAVEEALQEVTSGESAPSEDVPPEDASSEDVPPEDVPPEDASSEDVPPPEGDEVKTSAYAQLAALDAAMRELGVQPSDLEVSVIGTPHEQDGVKIAAAVREYRSKNVRKVARVDPQLRVTFKKYLRELMFGA